MYRLHQFSKVEMFVVSTPEQSDAIHDELIAIEEEMYDELGFHFKVLDMSSEDLGAPAYRKFDIEAWMPALERYGEISSASNCTDYQARRLNIKYRPNPVDGKKQPLTHCHTLNATACAVPRMIITILENFQARSMSHWSPYDPRRRGERRCSRTFLPGVCFSPPITPRFQSRHTSTPFSSASDAYEFHPDVALNDGPSTLRRRTGACASRSRCSRSWGG
jgi:hypothetical protein